MLARDVLAAILAGLVFTPFGFGALRVDLSEERELFRGIGRVDVAEAVDRLSVDEIECVAKGEWAELVKMRQEGHPLPRAEEKVRRLLALAPLRRKAIAQSERAQRDKDNSRDSAPLRVHVCRYAGAKGAQYHKSRCRALVGVISSVPMSTAKSCFLPCPTCFALEAGALGVYAMEDLRQMGPAISQGSGDASSVSGRPALPQAIATARDPYTLTATELYSAYKQNEVAADDRYKDRELNVLGEVDRIGKDMLNSKFVTLKSGQLFSHVQCFFDEGDSAQLGTLAPGSIVGIHGECRGLSLGNVLLKNSMLILKR